MDTGTLIYLDHNASAPICEEAAAAMMEALHLTGNPSSVHRAGRAVRAKVDSARRSIALLVGGDPERLILTSGGTEANNLALMGTEAKQVFVGKTEHPSVLDVREDAKLLPVDDQGLVKLDAIAHLLIEVKDQVLVSVMLANNETGVIQPVREIADLVHAKGGLMHCDAVQAAGRMPLCQEALGADLLSISAHKIGGPKGAGALSIRPGVSLVPLVRGGGQEKYRRAGTENVLGIIGFGAAAERAGDKLSEMKRVAALRDRIEAELSAQVPEGVIAGASAKRLPNTTCLALPGMPGETQVMAMDLAGIAVSAGSACSSGKVKASHVLQAMGVEWSDSAIRVSLGPQTTEEEVERFIAAYVRMADKARQKRGITPSQTAA